MKYVYESIVEPVGELLEVSFPDFGLITQGSDEMDAAYMAQDMLENVIVVMLQSEEELPVPTFGHPCPERGYRMIVTVACDIDTPQVETMTVNEAADILNVSAARVRAMIRSGILQSKKVGLLHIVDAQSVIDRYNNPQKAGRPKKAAVV